MATQEVLQEIRDHLGDLPERLARVMGKTQRDEKGRFQSSTGQQEPRIPSKWQAGANFAHSLGRFIPGFGKVAGTIHAGHQLGESWRDIRSAFGPRQEPPSGRYQPGRQPEIPRSTGGSLAPPLPVKAPVPGAPAIPTPANGAERALQSPKFFQELINEMKLLREEMRRVREATRQTEPDQSDDSERAPSPATEAQQATAKEPWNRILPLSSQHPDPRYSRPQGPLRREKEVPGNSEAGNGNLEKVMSIVKAFV
jgi:hypothetical protein